MYIKDEGKNHSGTHGHTRTRGDIGPEEPDPRQCTPKRSAIRREDFDLGTGTQHVVQSAPGCRQASEVEEHAMHRAEAGSKKQSGAQREREERGYELRTRLLTHGLQDRSKERMNNTLTPKTSNVRK